jgi:hypothetical protein
VLTLAEAALHAQRPSVPVYHNDRMRTVGLARAAQVFDLVAGAECSISSQAKSLKPNAESPKLAT